MSTAHSRNSETRGGGSLLGNDYTPREQAWPCDLEGNVLGGRLEEKKQIVRLCRKDTIPECSITPISQVQKLRLRGSHSDWCWVQIITSPRLPPSPIHTRYKQLGKARVWDSGGNIGLGIRRQGYRLSVTCCVTLPR